MKYIRRLIWYFLNKIFFNYENPRYYHWAYAFSERYVNLYRGDNIGDRAVNGEWHFLKEFIKEKNPKIIFDVGANEGFYPRQIRAYGSNAIVYSFEPVNAIYEQLRNEFKDDDRVIAEKLALSDQSGAATIYKTQNSEMNTLQDTHGTTLPKYDKTEEITCITLDEYCEKKGINHIDLLKIDVEGHDLKVLKGAEKMLRAGKVDTITFEYGLFQTFSHDFVYDFYLFLKQFGYTLYKMKAKKLEKVLLPQYERTLLSNFVAKKD